MPVFQDIYDAIDTIVGTIYSDHAELAENVFIEENHNEALLKGYCFQVGPISQGSNRQIDCHFNVDATVVITNTLACFHTKEDLAERKEAEKTILENFFKMVKESEQNNQLNETVSKFDFISNNGIEYIRGQDQKQYLMIQSTYNFNFYKPRGV